MQIVDGRKGSWQILLDELQGTAKGLDANLDENPGGVLDVVASGLEQARRLTELGEHAPGPLWRRRIREERLGRQARCQYIAVELGIALPGSNVLEIEHPAADVRREHPVLEPFDRGKPLDRNLVQAPQVTGERACFGFDRLPAEVFEEIVVRVHAVQRGVRRVRLVQVPKQVVDEVRQRFRNGHGDPSMVQ
jgi:hypothetical protein